MKTRAFLISALLSAGLSFSLAPLAQAEAPDNRDVVHNTDGHVLRNTFGNCVHTLWMSGSDECGRPAHRQIAEEKRTVYFEFNKSRLMESERLKLSSLANTLKSMNDISGVSVVGYADRIGSASYNERLSKQRAQVVEQYLRKRGYLNTTLAKTHWLGESAPVTQCPDNLGRSDLIACLQKDRRVTVEITYEDDNGTPNR